MNVIIRTIDKNLAPTVSLLQLPDSVLVATKVAKATISFDVKANSFYLIKITAVGKQSITKNIEVHDSSLSITVNLSDKIGNLEAVVVVSKKPLLKYEDDKTIVDAEPLANSSTNAYEVLEKVPGAVVDQDGNVYLNSATPATIYINGREVKLSATDLASMLKSLPANSITKIEILRNPSAKYDAASSGGIVNIVLKKGVKLGTNGSVNLASFQGKYNTTTAGFNINKSIKKTNTYFSYQFTKRNNFEELNTTRLLSSDNTKLQQQSYTTYPTINHYAGGGIDAELNSKLSIGYDVRFTANENNSHAINGNLISQQASGNQLGVINALINNSGSSYYLGNNISAKYKIDSVGSELSSSIDYNYFNSKNFQQYNNRFLLPARPDLDGDGNTNNNKNILTFKSDLVVKLKAKYTIETGAKYNYAASTNSAMYFTETTASGRKTDSFQTNRFRYNEKIFAGYLQVSKTFFTVTFKPGIRMETTDIYGKQLFPKDTSLSIRRTDFFPYLYIRRDITKLFGFMLTGNAIYRRSISRPYYEALNPYPKYIDQFLYDVGNPNLKPQFTTNYEFNIIAADFPVFSIGVNDIKDIFTNVTYQDDVTKIAYRTYDNLGRNKEFYFRVAGGIPPGGKYFFYLGAQYNRSHYTGLYQNKPLEYTRGSWVFFTYHNFKASPTLNLSLHGFMRLRGLQNFYELNNFGALNINANKTILKKKANIILSINDILKTNKVDFSIDQSGISAYGSRVNDTRKIGITLRYNFGIKPKEEKKEGFDAPADTNN
ncbi:MAG: outer membrane beta-barrel protein [Ferruginibacter sp.]